MLCYDSATKIMTEDVIEVVRSAVVRTVIGPSLAVSAR
jgi:hypothetical protein